MTDGRREKSQAKAVRRRATVRDVARRARVSIGTVSRVVSGTTPVSLDLKQRVIEAAEALQFVPRARAKPVSPGRVRLVGCLVSDIANLLYGRVISAAEERLEQAGYTLVVANTGNRSGREGALLSLLKEKQFEGAIVALGEESRPDLGNELQRANVPALILDRAAPQGFDSINVDHRTGAREACQYLIGLGHRRIAMITASRMIRPGLDRIAGLHEALTEAGLPHMDHLIRSECTTADSAFAEMSRMIEAPERPTAVLSLGSQALAGVLRAIAAAGLMIPRDMSVIALGESELARVVSPAITCVNWDLWDLGRQAADILLHRIANRLSPTRSITIPTQVILRQSCMGRAQ